MAFLTAKVMHHSFSAEGPVTSLILHPGNTFPDGVFYSDALGSSPIFAGKKDSISNPEIRKSHLAGS